MSGTEKRGQVETKWGQMGRERADRDRDKKAEGSAERGGKQRPLYIGP